MYDWSGALAIAPRPLFYGVKVVNHSRLIWRTKEVSHPCRPPRSDHLHSQHYCNLVGSVVGRRSMSGRYRLINLSCISRE